MSTEIKRSLRKGQFVVIHDCLEVPGEFLLHEYASEILRNKVPGMTNVIWLSFGSWDPVNSTHLSRKLGYQWKDMEVSDRLEHINAFEISNKEDGIDQLKSIIDTDCVIILQDIHALALTLGLKVAKDFVRHCNERVVSSPERTSALIALHHSSGDNCTMSLDLWLSDMATLVYYLRGLETGWDSQIHGSLHVVPQHTFTYQNDRGEIDAPSKLHIKMLEDSVKRIPIGAADLS